MAGYKAPDFNERTAAAQMAKKRALEQLRAKPAADPAVVAAQKAARAEQDRAAGLASAAKKAAMAEAKAAKAAAKAAEAAAIRAANLPPEIEAPAQPAPTAPVLSAAEQKAARDARYAARKMRKR